MSEAVKNRQVQRSQVRQIQQEQAERKKELAARQREDLTALKDYYSNENRELDAESSAAVSHLNSESRDYSANAATYNRSGSLEGSKVLDKNFSQRKDDNFYKLQDRGSELSENDDGYIIKAFSPEYEKDQVRVTVQNNKAVVSGNRKFQDTSTEENKKLSTNNFQSFREEFQLDSAVSSDGMTKERDGDFVRVFVPKTAGLDFSENE